MKNVLIFVLSLCSIGFSTNPLKAQQLSGKLISCNAIHASFSTNKATGLQSYSLEKMIAPDVWSLQEKVELKNTSAYLFSNLKTGVYRVSLVVEELPKKIKATPGRRQNHFLISRGQEKAEAQFLSSVIEVKACDVTANNDLLQVNIFPNPTNDLLNVNIPTFKHEIEMSVEIYTTTGTRVLQQKISSESEVISLRSFSDGIYFVQVSQNGVALSYKRISLVK